ncbi:MAG TPA: methyltransferase [Candidatus Sulfotelmatobacter sp.]|nr:methyltransferase [Candidatus Sulfotelmatobacter sp.]
MKIINWKYVWEFILTLLIPLLYLGNIYEIMKTPNSFKASYLFTFLGIVFAIVGLSLWILSYVNLGKSFGVLPQEQKRIKIGLYKHLNHPMYIAIWLTFLGLSLANSSAIGLIYLNLIITPLLFVRSHFEDKKLKN